MGTVGSQGSNVSSTLRSDCMGVQTVFNLLHLHLHGYTSPSIMTSVAQVVAT